MSNEELHSEVGASGAHRWMKCPGSVALSRGMPNPSSPFAEEGTRAHELGEKILLGASILPPTSEDAKEMLAYTHVYTNFVLGELNRCQAKQASTIPLQVEEEISLTSIDERMFGTVDAMFYCASEGTLYVFDLKYGKGIEVDVEDNPQLMYYALAGWTTCFASKVILTIVQPRTDGQAIKRVTYMYNDMMAFAKKLENAIEAINETPDSYIPGISQCRWCIASAVCPALSTKFTAVTTIDPKVPAEEANFPVVGKLTPEELSVVYANTSLFKKWLDDVNKTCVELTKAGVHIPNTKLVEQRKHRVFKNPKTAIKTLVKKGFSIESITTSKLITPAQLEKLGVEKGVINTLTITPKGVPVLAHESDKRPAMEIDSAGFTNTEEES
jgi:hypothetical protein